MALHEARESAQTHIVLGTDTFAARDPRRYALAILANLLGGGMSSRLFQRVREELGLAYAVYAFQQLFQSTGMVGVYVGTQPGTADAAEAAIRDELSRLAREGLPEEELAGGRQQLKGQVMLSLESPSSRMHRLRHGAPPGPVSPARRGSGRNRRGDRGGRGGPGRRVLHAGPVVHGPPRSGERPEMTSLVLLVLVQGAPAPSSGTPGASECAEPKDAWLWCDDFEVDRSAAYFEYIARNGAFTRAPGVGIRCSTGMRARSKRGRWTP